MNKLFRIASDLHLEFYKKNNLGTFINNFKSLQEYNKVPNLILAGDICTLSSMNSFEHFLNEVSIDYNKIFYVLGNHEMYSDDDQKITLTWASGHYSDSVYSDSIKIFGGTLWSNATMVAFYGLTDSFYVSRDDTLKKHNDTLEFLENKQAEYDLIITHHMPSIDLIDAKYKVYSRINSVFGALKNSGFWIYGHTHSRKTETLQNRNFVCNP